MSDNIQWHTDPWGVCKKCGSSNILMIEYGYPSPEYYDGVSEFKCLDCDTRIGRWTGKELKLGFIEPRYGRGGEPVPIQEDEDDK